jgi:tRNA C32,U32 (ribose-2'-O)-methylase TrmJ
MLEKHAGREDARAHQVLETAKLVTTFSAAIAATFVATALAEGPAPSRWDWGAVAAMGLAA